MEKAYEINAYDKELLGLMVKTRDEISEARLRRREILEMKMDGIRKIAELKDDTRLVLEIVKLHFEIGKEFYAIGDYEDAIVEWREGIAIAKKAERDFSDMDEERAILVKELESIYKMGLLNWKRGDYAKSKEELTRGLDLIGKALK